MSAKPFQVEAFSKYNPTGVNGNVCSREMNLHQIDIRINPNMRRPENKRFASNIVQGATILAYPHRLASTALLTGCRHQRSWLVFVTCHRSVANECGVHQRLTHVYRFPLAWKAGGGMHAALLPCHLSRVLVARVDAGCVQTAESGLMSSQQGVEIWERENRNDTEERSQLN